MIKIKFQNKDPSSDVQHVITAGFTRHTIEQTAPLFEKKRLNWLAYDSDDKIIGALTADLLWDWIYIDELWVHESHRGKGLGKKLMMQVEDYAALHKLTGLWLWTQSWQAADFYTHLGYMEFTRFPDFPKGHSRIGFRKELKEGAS